MEIALAIVVCASIVLTALLKLRRQSPNRPVCGASRPPLRQFGDLTEADFQHHPIWIACHTADYDEPWYDVTDEETFRPWHSPLPAQASEGMLLVKATVRLNDGTTLPGFATPASQPADLGTMQPHLFAAGRQFGFWCGILPPDAEARNALYTALGCQPNRVFPLSFRAEAGLTTGYCEGTVNGFISIENGRERVDR